MVAKNMPRRLVLEPLAMVIEAAGLPDTPGNGPQKLRRSSASHLERVCPGSASHHLGHLTPDMAIKHYLDPRIFNEGRELPPPIEGDAESEKGPVA